VLFEAQAELVLARMRRVVLQVLGRSGAYHLLDVDGDTRTADRLDIAGHRHGDRGRRTEKRGGESRSQA
jgi:hypothetical protein